MANAVNQAAKVQTKSAPRHLFTSFQDYSSFWELELSGICNKLFRKFDF